MNNIKQVVIIVMVATFSFGCHKSRIEERGFARVTVTAYWDLADLQPQNATLLIYDAHGRLYKEARVASQEEFACFNVNLEVGQYTMVVFNELRDQVDKVRIRGWENFQTLEAYIVNNEKPLYPFVNNSNQVHQPGILATANCRFEVTENMLKGSYLADNVNVVELFADRKTAQSNITVTVKGLSNARMPVATQLRNMASSYFFATDRNSLVPVSSQFPMSNRTYFPGSTTDGTISTTITTFGVLGEWHHVADTPDDRFYLDLAFMLVDKQRTVIEIEEDITDLIEILVNTKLQVTLNINLHTAPLPDVIPDGGGGGDNNGGSGFNADLADWNDIIVKIPM